MPPAGTDPITEPQMKKLNVLLDQAGLHDREDALTWISGILGTEISTRKDLTTHEASRLIDVLADGRERITHREDLSKPSVQEVVARVMHDIGQIGVGKGDYNRQQNYYFRGIDAFVQALSPILSRHGVICVPRVTDHLHEVHPTSSGGRQIMVFLTVAWRIYGPRGDFIEAITVGQAFDSGDKAANKAMSAAFKYLLGQVFAVPNIGWSEQDADSPSIGDRYEQPAQQSPTQQRDEGHDALVARVKALAKDQGLEVENFTAKFRQQNGNISVEQLLSGPQDLLYGFVRRVEAYRATREEPGSAGD